MPNQRTIPVDPRQPVVGYIVNSDVPEGLHTYISSLQIRLGEKFPEAIWSVPRHSLHITLMDWLAPLVDYGRDKDDLFASIGNEYIEVLSRILEEQGPIPIVFDTIEAFPAAIIIKGHDDGSYEHIRKEFLSRIKLLPETKQPPNIIHTTICKFLKPIEFTEVENCIQSESLRYTGMVRDFRLVREDIIFMSKYEILKRFTLN